jgi:hypothetical protein
MESASHVVHLDRWGGGALQDCPVNWEMALNEGFLEGRREAEALDAARLRAVPEEGEPLMLGGKYLVVEEVLCRAADLLRSLGNAEDRFGNHSE